MPVVYATNFSDAAQSAASAAALLAARAGEPLWLVHALPAENVRAFGAALLEAAEGALEAEAKRLSALGAKVERKLLTGEAHAAVADFARDVKASLVVTTAPSHQTSFLGVGGTVDRLAQTLPMPLLSIREPASLEAWARGERPLKVVLGTDRSQPFEASRDWLRGLSRLGPLEVVAARIFWPAEEYPRFGLRRPVTYGELTPELRSALEREVSALVEPLTGSGLKVRIRLEVGVGRIADHLVEVAEDEKADLLVVGTHHRKALAKMWSVSFHVVRLAQMSVVCVPTQAARPEGVDAQVPVFREVLVATDFSEAGNRAVPYAFSLLPQGGTVRLLHVSESPLSSERESELRERLQALVPRAVGKQCKVELSVLSDPDVPTAILQQAERFCVDALCMGTHARGGLARVVLGSVAQAVMARTDRPVMVVRPLKG